MKRKAGLVPLFLFLSLVVLFISSFLGCSTANRIPAEKIASGKVTLSWSEVPGAVSYNVHFDGKPGLTEWTSHKITNASNPITVTDLAIGNTYYFGIVVVSNSGESNILSEKPYAVTREDGSIHFADLTPEGRNLISEAAKGPTAEPTATAQGESKPKSQTVKAEAAKEKAPEGRATLAWDNVANAISYNIYWGESPGVTKRNGRKIINATNPYIFKGLTPGKNYYFVVTAVNSSGESKESKELSFRVKE